MHDRTIMPPIANGFLLQQWRMLHQCEKSFTFNLLLLTLFQWNALYNLYILLTSLTPTNNFQRAPSSLTPSWCLSIASLITFTTRQNAGTSISGTRLRAAPAGIAAWSSAPSPCSFPAASMSSAESSSCVAPPRSPGKVKCRYHSLHYQHSKY